MRKMRTNNIIIVSITALAMLVGGLLAIYYMMFDSAKIFNALDDTSGFNVTVFTSNTTGSYANNTGASYNSPYETIKSQITVQFCNSETGALVASHTFDKIWGDTTSTTYTTDGVTYNYGSALTKGEYYKVQIIAPTFMRYKATYYVEQSTTDADGTITSEEKCNEYSNIRTFMIYFGDTQSLSIEVLGLQDNSWIASYN